MSALHIHLLTVHVPVVGCMAALVILITGHVSRQPVVFKLGEGFLVACAVLTAVAHFSGPPALALLSDRLAVDRDLVDRHGLYGQACFVGMAILGAAALSAVFQRLQGDRPGRVQRWFLTVGCAMLCPLLIWTAHLGGRIRHTELQDENPPPVNVPAPTVVDR